MSESDLEPDTDVNQRLRRLEIGAEVQAQILTNIQEMLLEADRLTESIGRLGAGAGSLSAALMQVDKQQQILTRLSEDLHRVEIGAASKEDLAKAAEEQARKVAAAKEEQQGEALQFRKQILQRIFTTAMVLVTLLAVIGIAVFAYTQSRQDALQTVCESRTEQNLIIIDVLEKTIRSQPGDAGRAAEIREDIERFRALNSDCEGL